jgi:hypothetical protein
MKAVVVDTNVPIVANGAANHATPDCVLRCVDRLQMVVKKEKVLLDDGMYILHEYMGNLAMSGQPGMGDSFMKWVWLNQANPKHCEIIPVTPLDKKPYFREFPNDDDLDRFDISDRKFVAVAKASGLDPPILSATDTDWWNFKKPLHQHGVKIEFICPELMV